jgi:hypothetical protein
MQPFSPRILTAAVLAGTLAAGSFGLSATVAQDATPTASMEAEQLGYPNHIHEGTCDNLDPAPLHPLANLVFHDTMVGDAAATAVADTAMDSEGAGEDQQGATPVAGDEGMGGDTAAGDTGADMDQQDGASGMNQDTSSLAIPVAVASTTIDATIDDLTGGEHALNVHHPVDPSIYVSCGNIGGEEVEDGNLFIGLRELDGSGFNGVAWFFPQGEQTTVTVFLTNGMALGNEEAMAGMQATTEGGAGMEATPEGGMNGAGDGMDDDAEATPAS